MPSHAIKRALISVHDKTGIVEFARALSAEFGIEIISTGGTAKLLKASGVPVTLVEEVTGFPEMLDGRVKTLHPKIHAGILADRDNPDHMRQLEAQGIKPIDMVVVSLYPFEETIADPNCTFEQAIEMIDIGGPCMLRAAAKNHRHVLPVCFSCEYLSILELLRSWGDADLQTRERWNLRSNAFLVTAKYDASVAGWMRTRAGGRFPYHALLELDESWTLRYGENPHTTAAYYGVPSQPSLNRLVGAFVGDAPSYNNLLDTDAALALCSELSQAGGSLLHPTGRSGHGFGPQTGATSVTESNANFTPHVCLFIKHNNACGVGVADDPIEAYRRAYLGDVNAAMGGVLAVNFPVTVEFAEVVMDSLARWGSDAGAGAFFIEVWLAPSFCAEAAESVIRTRKKWGEKVRLGDLAKEIPAVPQPDDLMYRSIAGGMLVQTPDTLGLNEEGWKVVTERSPNERELADLRLAWLTAKHTKSNAISICKDGMLIGNGAGQMSRVMSCRIATWLATDNGHAEKLPGAAAASDAFFPFRDGPDLLLDTGVTALIQPGGSKRDEETIAACNERGATMIFTGTRHFRH